MGALRGVLGLLLLVGIAVLFSKHRRGIAWRTVLAALGVQILFAVLVLRTPPGQATLKFLAEQVETLIGYTKEGTSFIFGPLLSVGGSKASIFALQVLPVIIFLGALIFLLYYLRVIQYVTWAVGGAIAWLLRVSNLEGMYAATVIFLGQSEAPLMIAPYLSRLNRPQVFAVVTAGFAAAAGSTLVGYALLGAPLPYLLAATAMNAPASLFMAKLMWPDSTPEPEIDAAQTTETADPAADNPDPDAADAQNADVRKTRDTESANAIDAIARGTLAGGKIAVTVGALLLAFVALIALANGILGGIGGWFGVQDLTAQSVLGSILSPLAWLLGVPWSEATQAGAYIGEKTILNEFVAFSNFGPQVGSLAPVTVVVVTFALAGFANFGSIAIQIGTLGSLRPELRSVVASVGLRALLAGSLANLANAAIAGVVFSIHF
ncbi:MAG: nucleoside transporter C-terminal domain-containing protein [Mycobacteriaceae bacterium]